MRVEPEEWEVWEEEWEVWEGVATLRPVSGMIRGKVEKTGWTGLSKRRNSDLRGVRIYEEEWTGWMNIVEGEHTRVSMAKEK